MTKQHTIFVVDDHETILSTVQSILIDERYRILTFGSAETLQERLQEELPDLILLDIWLPGIDGIEALQELKRSFPDLPVILMSGHAGIDVAVAGMKAGAADFLEKPLNLDSLLEKIAKHLPATKAAIHGKSRSTKARGGADEGPCAASIVSSNEQQCTIRRNAVMNGVGLLSGRPTGIIISPMPVNSGIVFRTMDGVDIQSHITSLADFDRLEDGISFTANSTVLTNGRHRIRTVEHLLATLSMMGITNASIKVDEEIPNIDGSAADFCRIIGEAGIEVQSQARMDVVIHQRIGLVKDSDDEKYLYIEPFDGFEVAMRVNFPAPILEQKFLFNPAHESFETAIAPARSFNTFENIDMAQKKGMAGSGFLNSHIIIHDGKVINTTLNFPDEFVRHKILDLLGDIALVGHRIRGRIVGNMTSHGLNQQLALKIFETLNEGPSGDRSSLT